MKQIGPKVDFVDSLRGMFLLGIYGDVLGATQENATTVSQSPKSNLLLDRNMPNVGDPWGTWISKDTVSSAKGIPTDDSCFRLFLLHPWLRDIAAGNSQFDEDHFKLFLTQQRQRPLRPSYLQPIRDQQIDEWLAMYTAHQENTSAVFYEPSVPIVFGMFMFAEAAAVFGKPNISDTFQRFENISRLDQTYAPTATGFFATLIHLAISADKKQYSFEDWFFTACERVVRRALMTDNDHHSMLIELFHSMRSLGKDSPAKSAFEFAREFNEQVVRPENPPFMTIGFSGNFDPFRFLAQIVATVAHCRQDILLAIRTIAFSTGDTDTTASMLGTLAGAYIGERELRRDSEIDESFDLIEQQLLDFFGIRLTESATVFLQLSSAQFA